MNEDNDLVVLGNKLLHCGETSYVELARIARDHYAMTAKRREHILENMYIEMRAERNLTRQQCDDALVRWGAIPPRPEPSLGEMFAALIDPRNEESGEVAKKFDILVSKLPPEALKALAAELKPK